MVEWASDHAFAYSAFEIVAALAERIVAVAAAPHCTGPFASAVGRLVADCQAARVDSSDSCQATHVLNQYLRTRLVYWPEKTKEITLNRLFAYQKSKPRTLYSGVVGTLIGLGPGYLVYYDDKH